MQSGRSEEVKRNSGMFNRWRWLLLASFVLISTPTFLCGSLAFAQTPGKIQLVQKTGFNNDAAMAVSQDFTLDNAAGDLLIAFVASVGTAGYDVTKLFDSQGNIWIQAGRATNNTAIWYVQNCKAGPNTVSIEKSGSVSRGFLAVAEYFGAAQAGVVLDQTTYGFNATSTVAEDEILVGYPGALLVSLFNSTAQSVDWSAPSPGFAIEAGANSSFVGWADNLTSIQGQNAFQITSSATDGLGLKMAAFLPSHPPPVTPGYNFIRTCESLNKTLSPTPGSPSRCTFPGGNNPDDLVLAVCNQFSPNTDQVMSVTDTSGNSYVELFSRYDPFWRTFTDVFASNGSIATNASNTVSCNFNSVGVTDSVDALAIEYSGQASGDIFDTSASDSTETANDLSYSITPTSQGELLFSVNVANSGPNVWSGLGIETDREPSRGNSNNETRIADLLLAPSGASAITVTRATAGLSGFTLALKSQLSSGVPVLQPSNLSATISPNPVDQLGTLTVTGTVPGVKGFPTPTGVFSISADGANPAYHAMAQIGSGPIILNVPANLFTAGTSQIGVSYSGDASYAAAEIMLPLTVTVPYAVSATPVTVTVPGATTNNGSTITISPMGGFAGIANLTCTLSKASVPPGVVFAPTCNIPGSASVTGTTPVSVVMTVLSTPSSSTAPSTRLVLPTYSIPASATAILFLVVVLFTQTQKIRPCVVAFRATIALFLVVSTFVLAACGGSGSGGGQRQSGTTAGTYLFVVGATVTGSDGASLFATTTNVTATIQ
jgi:hypothetical protein